ncbi:MAG: DNA polymerase III subunit alpha [Planctomycetes bacterium]|nr:DNA polymerase III subunit alpha [Planctomycetota bacterium]
MRALLGVQTYFTFHWGTTSPADWLGLCRRLGYSHVGIADHASLLGLPETLRAAAATDIAAFSGVTLRYGALSLVAFPVNALGYGNMSQLITDWIRRTEQRPDLLHPGAGGVPILQEDGGRDVILNARHKGLVLITNDLRLWRELRGNDLRLYWRVGPGLARPPREIDPNAAVFVPGPVLVSPEDYQTHRLLRAVGAATAIDQIPEADRYDEAGMRHRFITAAPSWRVLPPSEYDDLFAPFRDALDRADAIAVECAAFKPNQGIICPPTVTDSANPSGESAMARLRRLAYEGAVIRYGKIDPDVEARLEKELDLIALKSFAEYFLVVYDIVARLAGGDGRVRPGRSITCGRGSGAASLVNYCLGVTNVDVMRHHLMFERFLNEARDDPPDIDVDFAWDERDGVFDKVLSSYGDGRVARVANHNRYDARGAFRATARAYGYADAEITRHMREAPSVFADDPGPEIEEPGKISLLEGKGVFPLTHRVKRHLGTLGRTKGDWQRIASESTRLIDIPHTMSMHSGGVVMTPGELSRTVPVFTSRKGHPTIQWEKDGTEDMGLVKIDLLGNRSIAVIRDAVRYISRDKGIPEHTIIPPDPSTDEKVRRLVETGNTFGVFYIESPSMRLLMAKARRGDFEHAVIHSSIIRPAANAFINEYLRRLHGGKWKPDHPCLEHVFDETYGIPVYQEDIVKFTMALCNYDYVKADRVRKCLGKRDAKARLTEMWPEMVEAARANNVDDKVLTTFWRSLMFMTGYSFCKPHSASFAQVSFESAYIRAHYPAYFIAGVLSNEGGYYAARSYVSEAMRLGLQVLGPNVNRSFRDWRAEGDTAIRTGFMAILGFSREGTEAIINEREKNGRYTDLADFLNRVMLDDDDIRRLAVTGAFDSIGGGLNRPQILWVAGQDRSVKRDVPASATGSLFAAATIGSGKNDTADDRPVLEELTVPELPDYSRQERLEAEYASLDFIPGHHPMELFREDILEEARELARHSKPRLIRAGDLKKHVGEVVIVMVWPVAAKIVETKHGDAMMFQTFEDPVSLCETVIFPEEFKRYHRVLGTLQPLWVTGKVMEEFDVATLQIYAVRTLRRYSGNGMPKLANNGC